MSNSSPSIVIIGAGFGGIAAAIELKKAGYDDIAILEKGNDVGGVWRENTYPGAACDVPSPFYSYSFAPNPAWGKRYAPQPQILDYARQVAEDFDVRRHVRTNTEVVAAEWNDGSGQWHVILKDGSELVADVLVPAMGQLSRPALPRITGLDTFAGPAFHSAQWDHSVDLGGKRVAVIGTGASAIQFVPQIQKQVAHLALFQRTAPYIFPRMDAAYGPQHHKVFEKLPFTQRAERVGWWGYLEFVTTSILYARPMAAVMSRVSRRHMKKQASAKPGLFEKIWPDYPIGCKRILLSDNYVPALAQPNVDVITDEVAEVTPTGVRTVGGVDHEVDVLIYGTGFTTTEFLAPITFRGRGGIELADQWSIGAQAYFGLTVPNFPNMAIMYGPNTNTGGGSVIFFLETQAAYVKDYVRALVEAGEPLEVRAELADAFDEETQKRLSTSVWTECTSWYRQADGRITLNWPGLSTEYRRRAVFKLDDYTAAPQGVRA
ncbi:putative monooxygenase [Nocardioides baekrokdamisoli]|uniref:Putative monooxygenase n=1 Tax=Nocardioides baekrokdamisoli TaxID=1804624 RepID=A0A3G9IX31_9ACTN|nr:NAD(P)/FAD-dependent oxidoreductase [Nocardioides baekrokdamisoli]BBH16933.1 putative monooxygenase [Nocardioides baekrokdamisoli]